MPPIWLTVVSIGLAFVCAGAVLYDVFGRGYRQHTRVMEAVWPVTALYFGPLALWAYRRWGRPMSHKWTEEHGEPPKKSRAATTAVGTGHCGAGCTLGDIVGSPLVVFVLGWQIAGAYLYAEYVVGYALAFILGIAFQYYSIKPMRSLSPRQGLVAALKADFLPLTSFQVGLYAWMAVMQLVLFPGGIHPDRAAFWALMQVGMILGFATSYPVNWWLIRRGIKETM